MSFTIQFPFGAQSIPTNIPRIVFIRKFTNSCKRTIKSRPICLLFCAYMQESWSGIVSLGRKGKLGGGRKEKGNLLWTIHQGMIALVNFVLNAIYMMWMPV